MMTDDEAVQAILPTMMDICQALVSAGRQPDQAVEDLRRTIDVIGRELHRDMMFHVETVGELPTEEETMNRVRKVGRKWLARREEAVAARHAERDRRRESRKAHDAELKTARRTGPAK